MSVIRETQCFICATEKTSVDLLVCNPHELDYIYHDTPVTLELYHLEFYQLSYSHTIPYLP